MTSYLIFLACIIKSWMEASDESVRALKLHDVKERCGTFIFEHALNADNALLLRTQFSSLGCRSAITEVDSLIEKNFVPISRSEKFLELSTEDVIELLSKDKLSVPSEKEVFDAAMRWVEYSSERVKVLERWRGPVLFPKRDQLLNG
ncbi:BTB And Kelch [Ancylostoma duodenale]|uniref:BTB And Kelch n=1 Tax=Ancylostoma duodenale TaxID=51022 RepID=A0A0C2DNI0_9BILA|nr:BTB And Kelch [Ancylostoma duodenale]